MKNRKQNMKVSKLKLKKRVKYEKQKTKYESFKTIVEVNIVGKVKKVS